MHSGWTRVHEGCKLFQVLGKLFQLNLRAARGRENESLIDTKHRSSNEDDV